MRLWTHLGPKLLLRGLRRSGQLWCGPHIEGQLAHQRRPGSHKRRRYFRITGLVASTGFLTLSNIYPQLARIPKFQVADIEGKRWTEPEICRIPEKMGKVVIFSFPYKESQKNYFLLLSRDMNLKSAIYRIIMSRNRIFHRMTTTFSVGAVLFWSNSDLTLGECQHNDGHTPTACTTHHNYDLISVSIPNVHLDQCCLTSAVVYVINGFSGPRIQIIDTMYPCAIGPIGQMVMVHQPLLLN